MLGIVWFVFWQSIGLFISALLFRQRRLPVRLWLGSVMGSLLSAWIPVVFAFAFDFSFTAHIFSLCAGLLGCGALFFVRRRIKPVPVDPEPIRDTDRAFPCLLIPFMVLTLWLVYSHTLQTVNGSMYTGQCTYGDMPMHLGFITSIAEQKTFPPCYSILPGEKVCYPFLCDSISSSLYLLGTPLRWAYMIPELFAFLQVYCGVWFLAGEVCRRKAAPFLAFLFFFLNGGLGMIYFIKDYSLNDLFTGFYVTPTNLVDAGMRWVNIIADMLLPQRATLFGWAGLMAALYLLFRAVWREDASAWLPAGFIGGALPMIHTHSYFALGLMAAAWMVCSAFRDGFSRKWLLGWLRFGIPAVILALPQLFIWTLNSVNGNEHFLRFGFDWVNNGQTEWFWFWFKNVGPIFLISPVAFLFAEKEERQIFSGAILIFVICEFILFQPNPYDNNKLLYIAYLFAVFLSSDAVLGWLDKLSSRGIKIAFLAILLIIATNAAAFTLGREAVSGIPQYGYQLFDADEIAAAEYIKENTEAAAVFLTDDNHDNPVAVLTGRSIVCGSSSYLYFHGVDYVPAQRLAEAMLTDPAVFEANKEAAGVDYVYIGGYERAMHGLVQDYFRANYPLAYSNDRIMIYDVR